ncbi:LysM peptidoglycan-binding domain-containing protein [Demequina aurantiaca]|uniref:LysM peptidoglycan-binding domain-containing protein n=1 Tax=Demequina aurantiaca TaxID=676200 RepID=UPI000783875C|nr:LysM peptidoglycan-binding domain-containing protein [Demequina aurantiaca]
MKIYAPQNPAARAKRAALVVVLLAVAVVVGPQAFANDTSADASTVPVVTDTYVVMPGDTLWDIASSITPSGNDVQATVGDIQRLNVMESSSLRAGQELLLPSKV